MRARSSCDVPGKTSRSAIGVSLVKGKRLDHWRITQKYLPDLCGLGAVEVEPDGKKDQFRAQFARLKARHRRADAESSGLVVAGRDHAAPAFSADGHWTPRELRTFPQLNGGVEAVHVEMDDLAQGRLIRLET
jgi:hypothetical protein